MLALVRLAEGMLAFGTHCDEFLWKRMASHSTTHVPHSTMLLSTRNPYT